MAVGIDESHFKRAPTLTSSKNVAIAGVSSSVSEAAQIMPWDSRPRILRGLRFATTTTLRPISLSGSYHSARPQYLAVFLRQDLLQNEAAYPIRHAFGDLDLADAEFTLIKSSIVMKLSGCADAPSLTVGLLTPVSSPGDVGGSDS